MIHFMILQLIGVAVLVLFPQIALRLPNVSQGKQAASEQEAFSSLARLMATTWAGAQSLPGNLVRITPSSWRGTRSPGFTFSTPAPTLRPGATKAMGVPALARRGSTKAIPT